MDSPQIAPGASLPSPPDSPPAPDYYALLNLRQQRFVDAYLANGGNGTQAAITAGYSPDAATVYASQLLTFPNIKPAIEVKQAVLAARAALSRDEYIAQLREISEADGAEMMQPDSFEIKHLSQWPLALRRLIQGIEQSKHGLKVRLSDRLKAREMLGRALGFFEQESRGSTFVLIIQPPPGADEPRSIGSEIPLAPGITLLSPTDTPR